MVNIQSNAMYGLTQLYKKWYVEEKEMPYACEALAGLALEKNVLDQNDLQIAQGLATTDLDALLKEYLKITYAASKSDLAPAMILVQGGTFSMGWNDPYAFNDTKNVHKVTLSSFYIAQTEVTQEQYTKVMLNNPAYMWNDLLPMDELSWGEAVNYCKAVSLQTKDIITKVKDEIRMLSPQDYMTYALAHPEYKLWRLPTEAEWEFAARGGVKSKKYMFSGSNDISVVGVNDSRNVHVVGSKNANELGLFDMSGNIFEWCSDWYQEAYDVADQKNPTGPALGKERVMRGGATDAIPCESFFYSTTRRGMPPDFKSLTGVRPVRSVGK